MLWMCLTEAILIHIHNIRFYGEILKIIHFYHFDSDPRFPRFLLLYVRWKSGITFVRRCFRDGKLDPLEPQFHMRRATRKSVFGISDQVRHKPGCIVTEDDCYLCSENKGADQLCGYRTADLRLCFRICKKQFFS